MSEVLPYCTMGRPSQAQTWVLPKLTISENNYVIEKCPYNLVETSKDNSMT